MSKKKTDVDLVSDARSGISIQLTPELDHALAAALKVMCRDNPTGTIRDSRGAEHCMMCKRTVGTSAYYCKYCGQKIRETPDWVRNPYQE